MTVEIKQTIRAKRGEFHLLARKTKKPDCQYKKQNNKNNKKVPGMFYQHDLHDEFAIAGRARRRRRGNGWRQEWNLLCPNLSLTKLEPQSTLRRVTRHRDDTDAHHWTPLCFATGKKNSIFFVLFFFFLDFVATWAITCHKVMASTKSTVEPISLYRFFFFECVRLRL